MYMDPTSALLVALLFDSIEIISEKTRGGSIDQYHREQIAQMNRSLNANIRKTKERHGVTLPDFTIRDIKSHIRVAKSNFTLQQGYGSIIIEPDNLDYIVSLLEASVKNYEERGSVEEYRIKAEKYREAIETIKNQKEIQEKAAEEMRIKREKEAEVEAQVEGVVKLFGIVALAILLLFLIASFSS